MINILDTTLRDGSHAVAHQFTVDQVMDIAGAAENAGVDIIEISHGDGLGGSSLQYGLELVSDEEKIKAARQVLRRSKLGVLLLPGIGTCRDLEMAVHCGVDVARIATHVTEADIGEQHVRMAKGLGLYTLGALMMVHMVPVETLVEQARLFENYGADGIYLMDSAGTLTPLEVEEMVGQVASAVNIQVGFHAHNNLSLAVINSIAAIRAGARFIDCTIKGLGAGGGNTPLEVLAIVLEKYKISSNLNVFAAMDAAKGTAGGLMDSSIQLDQVSLLLGYAGVYSSFLLHAQRAANRFELDAREILLELGRRKMVGGQEDMILDVAYELSAVKNGCAD